MTGQELRSLRQALNLTQLQLGDALGIHVNTVARLERGELPITRRMATAVEMVRQLYTVRQTLDR
jgi:transcriptional regulator with XRE-family HTH domain